MSDEQRIEALLSRGLHAFVAAHRDHKPAVAFDGRSARARLLACCPECKSSYIGPTRRWVLRRDGAPEDHRTIAALLTRSAA